MNLCMDSYSMEKQQGRFYHLYADGPVEFSSLIEALKKMNALYDRLDCPQAPTVLRNFLVDRRKKETAGRGGGAPGWEVERRGEAKKMAPLKEVIKHRGEGATFLIRVKYRQNSSWQGEVTWVDGDKREYFRSALELMKLLDSALEGKI